MKPLKLLADQINRRDFLKKSALLTTTALAYKYGLNNVYARYAPLNNRVVWLHDSQATFWNGSGYYGSAVNQLRVNAMLDRGIKVLTGENNLETAWEQIIPSYSAGTKIAIKVNVNCAGNGVSIDITPPTVNAVIRGLKLRGVQESDIYIMDPSNIVSTIIGNPILAVYPNVVIWDAVGTHGHTVTFDYSPSASTTIEHTNPNLTGENHYSFMPQQLGEAAYLINMPIMKAHGAAEISLTFKNCFGLLLRGSISKLHNYALPYRQIIYTQNPLHDIYLNTNVKDKTVLIVGDGLFCSRVETEDPPEVWNTFGGHFPNSIFVSTDPVAIDSVMFDFLNAEVERNVESQMYLHRAMELNLGIHEHWNNASSKQYSSIDFHAIEMSSVSRSDIDQKVKEYKSGNADLNEVQKTIQDYLKGI